MNWTKEDIAFQLRHKARAKRQLIKWWDNIGHWYVSHQQLKELIQQEIESGPFYAKLEYKRIADLKKKQRGGK